MANEDLLLKVEIKVWVVLDEDYDAPAEILGVYSTEQAAIKAVEGKNKNRSYGGYLASYYEADFFN